MSELDERQQRILNSLDHAAKSLGDLVEAERTQAAGNVEMLEEVVAYARAVVAQSAAPLISEPALSSIVSHADAIAADPNGTAANARAYADPILSGIALLPLARDRQVEQAVREAAANYQRSVTQRLKAIEEEAVETAAAVRVTLEAAQADVEKAAATAAADFAQRAAAVETRVTEIETAVATQTQRLDAMVERQSASFTAVQDERAEEFTAELARVQSALEGVLANARQEVADHVAEIRRMEEESSGLVHSIGLGGTAERYGDESKYQRGVANRFRWLTICLALGAVGVAVWAVVHKVDNNSLVTAKLAVSTILGALAAYTAKQSGRHRAREERARNLQLELTAFAPFIEPLDDEIKEIERVRMTRKTFGHIRALPEAEDSGDHEYGSMASVIELIKTRRERAARAALDDK